MKSILVLLVVIATVKSHETYGTSHVNFDADSIVADEEEFKSYINCFTGVSHCTELAALLKKALPTALVEACGKCTPEHKHIVRVFNENFKKSMPEEFEKFKKAFDPENKYYDKFEEAVAGY